MTKDQVVQILGTPSDVGTGTHYLSSSSSTDGFSEVFHYMRTCDGQPKDWIVVFVSGQLTEYGPFVGDMQLRYGRVFMKR